jgi:hypothetical protein
VVRSSAPSRFFEGSFRLADFLLDFPGKLLDDAFGLQTAIVRQFSRFALDRALQFVKDAFRLIFGTSLHHRELPGCANENIPSTTPLNERSIRLPAFTPCVEDRRTRLGHRRLTFPPTAS